MIVFSLAVCETQIAASMSDQTALLTLLPARLEGRERKDAPQISP